MCCGDGGGVVVVVAREEEEEKKIRGRGIFRSSHAELLSQLHELEQR
jgi:hypothetical protein